LAVYYSDFFPKGGNETTILRIQRLNALLDDVIESKEDTERLFKIEKEILQNDKPNNWNIWKKNNMERVLEVDFMKFGISVTRKTGTKLTDMMTFEFYATVELLKEESKKK